jgi:aspartate carbamoyltransferase regulatory subunit
MQLLHLLDSKNQVTVGFNLASKSMGLKDIIKFENKFLTPADAGEIAIFAPEATINIVRNFEVCEKIPVLLPEKLTNVFSCPNPACVTCHDPVDSIFHIELTNQTIKLICHYCEKKFDHAQMAWASMS